MTQPISKKSLQKSLSRQQSKISLVYEKRARKQGFSSIAGVDEAGRGPLAGPVVAAACLFKEGVTILGIDDSKKLTSAKREALFTEILEHAHCGIGIVSHTTIDDINILQATHRAMRLAVYNLPQVPDYILVDGRPVSFEGTASESIVGGDRCCLSIAAASILAKVVRDRIMYSYHSIYPKYQYDKHKGYGTALHRELLKQLGPSPIQRSSFRYT